MTEYNLNAEGLICPLPVLKAQKVLKTMQAGDVLIVSVTDKNAEKEFRLFCAEREYAFKPIETKGDIITLSLKLS